MRKRLLSEICEYLKNELGRPVRPDSRLRDEFDVDSLDLIAMFIEVEERWGVRITDDEAASMETPHDVAMFVAACNGRAREGE